MPVPLRSMVTNVCGAHKVAFLAIDQSKDGKLTYKPNQIKGALKKRDKNKDGTMSLDEWINESAQKN